MPHSRRQRAEEAAEATYGPKRCASHISDSIEEEGEEDHDLAEEDSKEDDDQAADSDEHEQQEEHSADDEHQEVNTNEEDYEEDELNSYQVNLSELLRMENPKTPRQQWLVGYYHYLQSLSGKALSQRHVARGAPLVRKKERDLGRSFHTSHRWRSFLNLLRTFNMTKIHCTLWTNRS